jgi:DUF971 family protein
MAADLAPACLELKLREAGRVLTVIFADGAQFDLSSEYLRVESPSAEVQGHAPHQKQTVPGRRHVCIIGIEPVGTYGVRLTFDDLHATGIYSWEYLYELGHSHATKWQSYLDALASRGLSRDPT